MNPPEPGGSAGERIRAEIAAGGPIPFSRFMEVALYAPGVGYYQQPERPIGRAGDFYTSVSVGPVFGFLLAWRLAGWWAGRGPVELVEAAAHDGSLAHDILTALRAFHPAAFEQVRYRIMEPFAVRQAAQRRRLEGWGDRVAWVPGLEALGGVVEGVIFANELLDAFPVRRFGWDAGAGRWFEWGVDVGPAGSLVWCRLPEVPVLDFEVCPELAAVIPDGWVVEASSAAEAWWRAAACRLGAAAGGGRVVTFDYGFDGELPLRPERPEGSLRAYHRHRLESDLLARPGEQDLTAHVDFGRLRRVGEREGLATEAFQAQGRWLGAVAAEVFGAGGAASEWLRGQARGLQTLTHPQHLGQALKVLVQRHGGPGGSGLPGG